MGINSGFKGLIYGQNGLAAGTVKNAEFPNVKPCNLVELYRYFASITLLS